MKRSALAAAIALLVGSEAAGQEIVLDSYVGSGGRAMGMGGAFTALSDEFVGLFWNPAGLARATQGQAHVAFRGSRVKNRTLFFDGPSDGQVSTTRLDGAGLVLPYPVYRGSLVLAGGYARTGRFDSIVRVNGYDTVVDFQKEGVSRDRGSLGAFTVGGAVDVAPNLSIGVAVARWVGHDSFEQTLALGDTNDAHADTIRLFQRLASEDDFAAWGLRAGMHYAHRSGTRFGVSVASPVTFRIERNLEDEYEDVLDSGTDSFPLETFRDAYEVRRPFEFGAGLAWAGRWLVLSGDVVYAPLREARYEDPPDVVAAGVDDFDTQYRNTIRYHLGAELRPPGVPVALRAGIYRDPLPYVGGGSQPAVTVQHARTVVTLGLGGVLEDTVALDVAVQFGRSRYREGSRVDDVRSVEGMLSATYRFEAP